MGQDEMDQCGRIWRKELSEDEVSKREAHKGRGAPLEWRRVL